MAETKSTERPAARSGNPNDPGAKPNKGDRQAASQRSSKKPAVGPPSAPALGTAEAANVKTSQVAGTKGAEKMTEGFKVGQEAPHDLFAVMNDAGVEDALSTEPPERGHQLAFKGHVVDLAVIHSIDHVKRQAGA